MTNLKSLIEAKKKSVFVKEYQDKATDAETLGIMISQYYEWDGIKILETAFSALEDANFHTEATKVENMIENVKHPKS